MTEFFASLKSDLLDRRVLPLVGLVLAAVVAAVAYAALGGGSSSSGTPSGPVASSPGNTGVVVTPAVPSLKSATAETTTGVAIQRKGAVHNPFTPLPVPASANATSKASEASKAGGSSSSTSSPSKGSESSKGSGGTSTGSSPTQKTKTVYAVAVQFGLVPAGVLPAAAVLAAYPGLKHATPLPSAKEKRIEFVGVTVGKQSPSASFTLAGEPIIHGQGACLPSTVQCKVIDLKEGKTEQLEYFTATGQIETWELRVVSISTEKATAARVARMLAAQAHVAKSLLGGAGVLASAGLRYSGQAGVLVFAPHRAFGARARTALHR